MKIGTTGTRTPFLHESELGESNLAITSSNYDITKREEMELRRAIDESSKMEQGSGKYYV